MLQGLVSASPIRPRSSLNGWVIATLLLKYAWKRAPKLSWNDAPYAQKLFLVKTLGVIALWRCWNRLPGSILKRSRPVWRDMDDEKVSELIW